MLRRIGDAFMQRRFRAGIGCQDSLLCLPRVQPSRTIIFRPGRLLAALEASQQFSPTLPSRHSENARLNFQRLSSAPFASPATPKAAPAEVIIGIP